MLLNLVLSPRRHEECETIIRLLSDTTGASAVEDGIVLGIFGAMILAGAPVIGRSVGDLCHAIGKFLGLL
jgi:Flp pilus assembly pilin Flp